jgi:hypothetical protein
MYFSSAKSLFLLVSQIASFVSARNLFQHSALHQAIVFVLLTIATTYLFWKTLQHIVRYTFISVAWILCIHFISEFSRSELAKPYIDLAQAFLLTSLDTYYQLALEFEKYRQSEWVEQPSSS